MSDGKDSPKIETHDNSDKKSIVKIFTQGLEFDYKYPWRAPTMAQWSGSGFILGGLKLVTNAHVASDNVYMEVQLAGDDKRYPATTKGITHECDLAMLQVDDPEFWEKTQGLDVGANPSREEKVKVMGFPMGGESLSVTDGIVSRVEKSDYAHSGRELLCTQVSAPINPGNSGGPVLNEKGEVCGVAHQGYRGGQNLGYMIPANVLSHFLDDQESLEEGFPELGIETQNLESPYLRKHYKMEEDQSGILVNKVAHLSACKGILKPGDILLSIDGVPINNDGSVFVNPMKKADYDVLIQDKKIGSEVTFKVWRNGEELEKTVQLNKALGATETIIPMEHGKRPTYYVMSGQLVIQPVTENFMEATRRTYKDREKEEPDDQLIAINMFLKSGFTNGYRGLDGALISEINGKKIRNMKDVAWATESNEGETHIIKLDNGKTIAIANLAVEQQQEILDRYYIDKDRSGDMPARLEKNKPEDVNMEEPEVEEDEQGQPLVFSAGLLDFFGGAKNKPAPTKEKSSVDYLDLARTSARPH